MKKKPAFRPHYNQLDELRSLVGLDVPLIALTATAAQRTKETILKTLCMKDCEEIIVTPNKTNIKFWVYEMKSTTSENFDWLVSLLEEKAERTPRMLIFFRQIKHIAEVYEHLITTLGEKAFVDFKKDGPNDDRDRLFAMFHLKTDEESKKMSVQIIKIRLVTFVLFYVQPHSVWGWILKGLIPYFIMVQPTTW